MRRALGVLSLAAAAAWFAVVAARGGLAPLAALATPARPADVLAATLLLAGVLAWGVFTWRGVLAQVGDGGADVPYGELLRTWAVASPARWLPGFVWQFVAVGARAPRGGAPRLLGSLLAHTAFSLGAAMVVAAATLPGSRLVRGAAVLAALALVHPAPLARAFALAARVARVPALAWRGGWRDGLRLLALHVASWLGYGAAFALLARGLTGDAALLAVPSVAALTGAAALAWVAGYAAIVAPAGLGPREVALALLLAPVVGDVAPALALLARAWSVAGELTLAAAVLAPAAWRAAARREVPDAG